MKQVCSFMTRKFTLPKMHRNFIWFYRYTAGKQWLVSMRFELTRLYTRIFNGYQDRASIESLYDREHLLSSQELREDVFVDSSQAAKHTPDQIHRSDEALSCVGKTIFICVL